MLDEFRSLVSDVVDSRKKGTRALLGTLVRELSQWIQMTPEHRKALAPALAGVDFLPTTLEEVNDAAIMRCEAAQRKGMVEPRTPIPASSEAAAGADSSSNAAGAGTPNELR